MQQCRHHTLVAERQVPSRVRVRVGVGVGFRVRARGLVDGTREAASEEDGARARDRVMVRARVRDRVMARVRVAHLRPPPKRTVFCQSIALGKGRLGMMSAYGVISRGTQPAAIASKRRREVGVSPAGTRHSLAVV
eukprot:scaffold69066_cov36-Phaeocystis_antarctica.AAC.1